MKQLRLLIARIDRIGDVVLSTAIPREVKKKRPESFVAVLVREQNRDIYLNNPHVDEILTLDEAAGWTAFWRNARNIRRRRFSHAFMLFPQERLNWILFFGLIPHRIGVGRKPYQLLSFAKYVNRNKYREQRHEADYCLDMARMIGIEPDSIYPEIHLSEHELSAVREIRQRQGDAIRIGINSTSGRSAPNIAGSEYRKLIEMLSRNERCRIVVTDHQIPREIAGLKGVEYPVEGGGVRKLICAIASLDLLITSSTGPMHIAAGLKVPTLSPFCPLPACSPKLWGPVGNRAKVMLPEDVYCGAACPGDPKQCLFDGEGGIDARKIYAAAKEIIAGSPK